MHDVFLKEQAEPPYLRPASDVVSMQPILGVEYSRHQVQYPSRRLAGNCALLTARKIVLSRVLVRILPVDHGSLSWEVSLGSWCTLARPTIPG